MIRAIVYGLLLLSLAAHAQVATQPMRITAVRADVQGQPAVADVLLSLYHTGSKTSYGRRSTDRAGVVLLDLPTDLGEAAQLYVIPEGQQLAVYQPAAGSLPAQSLFATRSLTVQLVPKRSPVLQEPAQIRARLEEASRVATENQRLRAQNAAMRSDVATLKADLERERAELNKQWADATGFTPEEVVRLAVGYANGVLSDPQSHTLRDRALAEFALGQFKQAGDLFVQAADVEAALARQKRNQALRAELDRQELLDLEATIETLRRAAAAYVAGYRFEEAAEVWGKAVSLVDRTRYPELWAQTVVSHADALQQLGDKGSNGGSAAAYSQSVAAYRSALQVFTREAQPQEWATAHNNLGVALREQASRSSDPEAVALLAQAVAAYGSALEVSTRTTLPQDWAMIQINLGAVLDEKAFRSTGPEAVALLAQAVTAYRGALEVYTREALPQEWAMTQNNFGLVLNAQASHSSGREAATLRAQAVAAYRSALEVRTRATLPQAWAATQNNLAIAFSDQASSSSGPDAVSLLKQAVAAHRGVLEVYTRATLPQDWARTQNNLGNALRDQADRGSGPESAALRRQAVAAFRSALEVITRETLPQWWVKTQTNLGATLVLAGDLLGAVKATSEVLEFFPDSKEALLQLGGLYTEQLFDYASALPLLQRLVATSPSVGNAQNLAESLLTNGRFSECGNVWSALSDDAIQPNQRPLRDTFMLACQFAGGNVASARTTANKLAGASLQPPGWGFSGTLHFLSTHAAFADHRQAWVALFTALDKADTSAFKAALREIQAALNSR